MTPHELAELDWLLTAPPSTDSFRSLVSTIRPRYQWYEHCARLASVLQRVADGEIRRLMIFMPPRAGKSEEVSRLFAAYYLARYPDRWVGLNSYSSDLAYTLSRAARENYQLAGGKVKGTAGAVKHWETPAGGGFWAAGVGGPITGKGFHLGIIDDPLKNAEEAASEKIRENHKEWYASTFYTREEPEGSIILIQTRWHEDDLSGWLLDREKDDDEQPEGWHVVNFPAVAEAEREPFPSTCTVEPDWRRAGEALCPERYPLEKLRKIEERIGGYYWSALYAQRPGPREGALFKVARIEIVDAAPAGLTECRAWDLGGGGDGSDYTAGVRMGTDGEGRFCVLDVSRGQWGPDERNAEMRQTAELDGARTKIRLAQDPGQAGKDQAQGLIRMLRGFSAEARPVTGDKVTRADPLAAQVNAGNVSMARGGWNRAFLEELRAFPFGRQDDQVDAAADAFHALAQRRKLSFKY